MVYIIDNAHKIVSKVHQACCSVLFRLCLSIHVIILKALKYLGSLYSSGKTFGLSDRRKDKVSWAVNKTYFPRSLPSFTLRRGFSSPRSNTDVFMVMARSSSSPSLTLSMFSHHTDPEPWGLKEKISFHPIAGKKTHFQMSSSSRLKKHSSRTFLTLGAAQGQCGVVIP